MTSLPPLPPAFKSCEGAPIDVKGKIFVRDPTHVSPMTTT
jgi:hypothetical protein